MRVLITGAGGFIGSHLVDRCRKDGHTVIGIDRKHHKDWSRGEWGCNDELYIDIVGLLPEVGPFDLCYHLAAESRIQPSFNDPLAYVSDNILGTANILELCRSVGAKMVYAGSSTADDDVAKNVYATTKYSGELLCKAWSRSFGLKINIARFYNVYGPRQVEDGKYATVIGIFERQLREGKKLTVTGDGTQKRDFTHVEDIVDGLVAVASDASAGTGGMYPLGTGTNNSIIDIARAFVADDRIQFIPRPSGESEHTLANVKSTKCYLGWEAKKSLWDYIEEVVKPCPC